MTWLKGIKEKRLKDQSEVWQPGSLSIYDGIPHKWESWGVAPKEGGEVTGSDLTKLPVAEAARMKFSIQG